MENDKYISLLSNLDEFAERAIPELEAGMYEQALHHGIMTNKFLARLEQKWWKGFAAYESMYLSVIDTAKNYQVPLEVKGDASIGYSSKYFALLCIHGRACQQFIEILALMRNGFADGAFSRWRSLLELSVYAYFIYDESEDVAKAYIEQAELDERNPRWAENSFRFKSCVPKVSTTFKSIFDKCSHPEKDFWYKEYRMACKAVHASPEGTFGRISNSETSEGGIPAGRSNWGFYWPARYAAISFYRISALFFGLFPNEEIILKVKLLERWVDVICEHLYDTVRICFSEESGAPEIIAEYEESRHKRTILFETNEGHSST